MAADVLTFADAVVSRLQQAFDGVGAVTEVTRDYVIQYDVGTFTGLKVTVMPVSYTKDSPATRREDNFDAEVVVVVAERYAAAGKPTRAWLDERVSLVERCVFDPLRKIDLPLMLDSYWAQNVEVTTVFDVAMLRENNVFWSEIDVCFRKLRQ